MFHNPIFLREIRGTTRDPKVIFLVLGFFVVLASILLFLWPASGVFTMASDRSMQTFAIFLMSNLALIILLVPAVTSPAITSERENNSFDLLYTTLLTPGEVLRGKLLASLGMVFLIVLISLPISALCTLSGGIGPLLLGRAFLIIFLAAFTYGCVGLAVSALCRTTFTALIVTYLIVALLAGCTWLPYVLLGRLTMLSWLWFFLRTLSPFDALYALLFPQRYQLTTLSQLSDNPMLPFYSHCLGMALVLLVFLAIFCVCVLAPPRPAVVFKWLAILLAAVLVVSLGVQYNVYRLALQDARNLGGFASPAKIKIFAVAMDLALALAIAALWRRSRSEGARYEAQYGDLRTTVKRKLTWPFYLIDPLKRKKPIGRFRNPVFVAEVRSKVFGNPKFILRGLSGCIIGSMGLLTLVCIQYATFLTPDLVRWAAVVFQLGIVAILAPAIASGSITDEIVSRTFLMLRMTPISALAVVLGKLKAGFLYVSVFLASSLPVLCALVFLDVTGQDEVSWLALWRVGAWLAIMVVTTIAFITAGFCASAFSRSTSMATALSYCFAAAICIVTLSGMVPDAFSPALQRLLLTANPMVAALRVTSDTLFPELPPHAWVHNLAILGGLALVFIVASAWRVSYIFRRQM